MKRVWKSLQFLIEWRKGNIMVGLKDVRLGDGKAILNIVCVLEVLFYLPLKCTAL